ncbi:MAG: Sec-independent protein secretion pathway component TatC [halophilic archaeon J07HX64]|jgi:Sec-independent protein secretion pathway component TatC|nr:MAG: Sec-independent protein secretion pathway component TatC [halophilic archaeon J07HX64]
MAGALDEDTAQTLATGRQTIASVLSSAQDKLKRVFLVFVAAWLLTFYLLRAFVWSRLKDDLVFNRLSGAALDQTEIVATDPFQVILLQVKIGLIVGILVALPVMIYYSRDSLKERGIWPDARIPLWKKLGFAAVTFGLFLIGLSYAYFFFFPIMFAFLAENAVKAGFTPTWSIVKWTEFIVFLSLSFALAAQLPLAMSASARTGVIKYETFRNKWRYAVVGIFAFGAMFSPPDPFTQVMWGVPLVALYFFSLGITKLAVLSKRAGETVSTGSIIRERFPDLAGMATVTLAAVYGFLFAGGAERINDLLAAVNSNYRFVPGPELELFGLDPTAAAVAIGAAYATVVVGVALFYFRVQRLEAVVREQSTRTNTQQQSDDADPGESAEVDVASMSQKAIEAAPAKAFAGLDQERALQLAQNAADNENPGKGRAILDRFDEAQELDLDEAEDDEGEDEGENEDTDEGGGFVTSTAAGMVDPFTESDTDEEDIGGYYYDLRFILDSLTSKAIWIVAVFMIVLAGSFFALFQGGIGVIREYFFSNMPDSVAEEPEIVVLHPVEALIFMLKFSTLLAALSIVPIVLYFAWPAIEQRFGVSGDQNVLLVWGGTMFVTLLGGTILGFVYVAPSIVSLLAWDAIQANMIITYRISSFGWLIILLTAGIGALAMIPVTMLLFNHGSIISYWRMRKSWRGVVLAIFAISGLLSPSGLFTMFLVSIPASLSYGLGLGLVSVYDRVTS